MGIRASGKFWVVAWPGERTRLTESGAAIRMGVRSRSCLQLKLPVSLARVDTLSRKRHLLCRATRTCVQDTHRCMINNPWGPKTTINVSAVRHNIQTTLSLPAEVHQPITQAFKLNPVKRLLWGEGLCGSLR